ncbi:fasciclin domain-containing protein [Mucilaginibacter sp. HMF5004]|uniref:fasciclin domain-containing protein n=1 Tax=Mucilaginibacter rivuli TaxID=2857527 RepID=UPI001C5D9C0C|nr:fasciclin domain-containing protein [Mucilaginibacter rivuli]MBW4888511.1 fasciclin domain-containing protein [Mucilaginibacter rivuli]
MAVSLSACRDNSLSYMVKDRQVYMFDQISQDTSLSLTVQALQIANMAPTLNTYGPFTFFAPDNAGWKQYFKNKGKTSLTDFTAAQLKTVLTYLIMPTRLYAANFIQGPQATASGAGDFLTLDISKGYKYNAIANGIAHVYQTDIVFSNGLVHKMDAVIDPPTLTIGQFLSQNPNTYSVLTAGLQRAGLLDTLTLLNDKNNTRVALTLFAETNDVLKAAGITTFANMPLPELKSFMLYHIIKGANFSSSYTPYTAPIAGIKLIERYDNTILTLDNQNWIYFNLADLKLINNSTIGLSASDILMRNGIIHNVDKHMVFDTTIDNQTTKRTQIYHYFSLASSFAYGVTGFAAGAPPPTTTSGNWRIYAESGTGTTRGTINCLFYSPHATNDSLTSIVKNIRRGTYRIEANYKGGGRGTYQLMCGNDLIGTPLNYGLGTTWEQKVFVGNYTFKQSGDIKLKLVCTVVGGLDLDCFVLTPVYK